MKSTELKLVKITPPGPRKNHFPAGAAVHEAGRADLLRAALSRGEKYVTAWLTKMCWITHLLQTFPSFVCPAIFGGGVRGMGGSSRMLF